ncbi:hypothetical protein BT93_L0474 [Corymbia citriodora subsp. variegata]|uniref:Secreted protein n=1 Tax=Corymbia citriodora subsp. variegata TaxID=360336 RepID=A0A8T0CPV8_CORYI|nr:hypothetical protein BT93_L0474 [Corymbia citriodora subsp. variegata]
MYILLPIFSLSLACFSFEPRFDPLLSINCRFCKQRRESHTFQRMSLILQRVMSITYQASTDQTCEETLIQRLSNKFNRTSFKFLRNCSAT